jgi:hypothetical protein
VSRVEDLAPEARNPRPSLHVLGRPGAVDVDVAIMLDGVRIEGKVSLIPAEYDGGPLGSWGTPHHWVQPHFLSLIMNAFEGPKLRLALDLIEDAARMVAEEKS